MNIPKVSIGVPVYNGENYLGETLECLVEQTFDDFEIVISDNASTDRTAEICQEFAARDSRIRYHRNKQNIGAVRNYNKVFELSRAPYFTWSAHDDLYDSTYLERCVDVLDRSPDVVLAHSDMWIVGPTGTPLPYDHANDVHVVSEMGITMRPEPSDLAESAHPVERFRDVLFRMYWCTDIFGVIRRDALSRTSLHENYYGSDKVLLTELALMGRYYHVREKLFRKRCHQEMSFFKGTKEQAAWINPQDGKGFAPFYLLQGYTKAAINCRTLTAYQRASCTFIVFQKFLRAGFWKRLFQFGPNHPIALPVFKHRRISSAE